MDYSADDLRRAYVGVTLRAVRARDLLAALAPQRVWVDAAQALDDISRKLYFSERYDAERYFTLEAFQDELQEGELAHVERALVDGTACYVVRPVSDNIGVFKHYHNGVLGAFGLKPTLGGYMGALDAAVEDERSGSLAAARGGSAVNGLSALEASFVAAGYHERILARVHALRQLRTALEYTRHEHARTALARAVRAVDPDFVPLLDALYGSTCFNAYPPAATHFSSPGSDGINAVRALPEDKTAFLAELGA